MGYTGGGWTRLQRPSNNVAIQVCTILAENRNRLFCQVGDTYRGHRIGAGTLLFAISKHEYTGDALEHYCTTTN
jgi:hypothetical protein